MNVSSIAPVRLPEMILPEGAAPGGKPGEFQSMLSGAIGSVEHLRSAAGTSVERFLAGEGGEVHSVALAAQRASLEFELALQVRNKVVAAYQEVMRMQL